MRALLDPLNVLFLTQLFGHLLAQADDPSKRRRTYLAFDELTRVAGEGKPLAGFQDVCEQVHRVAWWWLSPSSPTRP